MRRVNDAFYVRNGNTVREVFDYERKSHARIVVLRTDVDVDAGQHTDQPNGQRFTEIAEGGYAVVVVDDLPVSAPGNHGNGEPRAARASIATKHL